jgi:hypothetical protein
MVADKRLRLAAVFPVQTCCHWLGIFARLSLK